MMTWNEGYEATNWRKLNASLLEIRNYTGRKIFSVSLLSCCIIVNRYSDMVKK